MNDYCNYNAGRKTELTAADVALTVEPDLDWQKPEGPTVREYELDTAPEELKAHFKHLIGTHEEQSE